MNTRTFHIGRWSTTALILAALVVSSGCEFLGLSDPEVQQPAKEETKEPAKSPPVPAVEEAKASEEEEYVRPEYPNRVRRNPFQPDPEVVKPVTAAVEGEVRPLEPLERFGLGELSLVAIISEVAVPKAMFVDPDGFGHVVKEGDRIGSGGGVISDVRDNEVEITEGSEQNEEKIQMRTIKLRDAELATGEPSGLSEEEREQLQKMLQSEEGRKMLEEEYREMSQGSEGQQPGSQQPRERRTDERFRGIAPPGQ